MKTRRIGSVAMLACLLAGVATVFAQVGRQAAAAAPGTDQPQGAGQAAPPPGDRGPGRGPQQPMSFFVTSVGIGRGGDLGGLAGADAHCQALATAAGRGNVMWHAYLSTQGPSAVNARDRIGKGPWYNARGQIIAAGVA